MTRLHWLLLAAALVACSPPPFTPEDARADSSLDAALPEASAPDAAAPESAPPFVSAPHELPPQVVSMGGPIIARPRLVVVTFADDPLRAQLEDFGRFVGSSEWFRAVSAEYGVGPGTLLGTVRRTENAPDTLPSTALEALLAAGLDDGSIPSPPDGDFSNTVYLFFTPRHTAVQFRRTGITPQNSCTDFYGFHSEFFSRGRHLVYSMMCNCPVPTLTELELLTFGASHEYAEAVTDPFPFSNPAYRLPRSTEWAGLFRGDEVTDLCLNFAPYFREGGFLLARSWSNAAAASDRDPCVPALNAEPYFNLSADLGTIVYAGPGTTVDIPLTGYSAGPVSDFIVFQSPLPEGALQLRGTLSQTRFNNGVHGNLSLRVPTTARAGQAGVVGLESISTGPLATSTSLLLAVVVQ